MMPRMTPRMILAHGVAALLALTAPAAAQPAAPSVPAVPAGPAAPAWVPRGGAELQALDKVNARSRRLTLRDGQSAQYGSLTITVQACDVRPPDQPADAAAFLVVTDQHQGGPGFEGWMVRSDPAASMLEHPIYDVRVLGCTP
jgi:hypothetical protein